MIRLLINILLFILPPTRAFGFRRFALRLAGFKIGRGVVVCGHSFIYGRGDLSIDDFTWISPGTIIRTHPDAPIRIGRNCDIGTCVDFTTGSHVIAGADRRAGDGFALPISIGDGCWIGARSLILGGVNIGPGSVVAAGAVVVSDVSSNSLVGGVPARVIKRLV